MNKIKCRLLLHEKFIQIDMGTFESIAAAKNTLMNVGLGLTQL